MSINKLGLYCQLSLACGRNTIYPPIKQFSSNPTNELLIFDINGESGSNNLIFSIDGTRYWTTKCITCASELSTWTLYWGLYMNQSSDLLDSPYSYQSTNDIDVSSIYTAFIAYNDDKQLISFPSFDTNTYDTLVVFIDHDTGLTESKSFTCPLVTNCILFVWISNNIMVVMRHPAIVYSNFLLGRMDYIE